MKDSNGVTLAHIYCRDDLHSARWGNDPKLAELFAHAELRRGACTTAATLTAPVDWVTSPQNPGLRGRL